MSDYYEYIEMQRKVSIAIFRYQNYLKTGEPMKLCAGDYTYDQALDIDSYMKTNNTALWKECEKINHAYYQRVRRLKERIANMLENGKNLFLTLTFRPKVISKTKDKTRREYVTNYLKQFNCEYVANIDFGEEHETEHYHAVLNTDFINPLTWKYGNLDVRRVRDCTDKELDCIRLAKYVAKLTNHAIKETAKRNYMIYSRKH